MRRWAQTAVLGLGLAAACGGTPEHTYPPEVVEEFVTTCARQSDARLCHCALSALERRFTLEEFQALERRIRAGELPREMADAAAECQ